MNFNQGILKHIELLIDNILHQMGWLKHCKSLDVKLVNWVAKCWSIGIKYHDGDLLMASSSHLTPSN